MSGNKNEIADIRAGDTQNTAPRNGNQVRAVGAAGHHVEGGVRGGVEDAGNGGVDPAGDVQRERLRLQRLLRRQRDLHREAAGDGGDQNARRPPGNRRVLPKRKF